MWYDPNMSVLAQPVKSAPQRSDIPPLIEGDRLTRPEFERRYHAMHHVKNAELVEGVVYMPSPVRISAHSEPHATIVGLLFIYYAATPGTAAGDNGSLRLDLDNMPQPDAYLRKLESHGGQAKLAEDDYLEGAPEFVFEIAASSATIDLHDKLRAYRRNGVKEYVVWLTFENEIRFHTLHNGEYLRVAPDELGIVKSQVFPGLWFDIPALLERNPSRQVATLQAGINSRG